MAGFSLGTEAHDADYRVVGHDSVTSTNALALDAAKAGDPGGLWVVARQQTAGRGRRGRPWQSPHGNLAASLLLRPSEPAADQALLGFVAGVALAETLTTLLAGRATAAIGLDEAAIAGGRGRVALKWPNDVLADGAKLAGILLEGQGEGRDRVLVIGLGVNVVAAPQDTPYPATALASLGIAASAEEVFLGLSDAWARIHALWAQGAGRAAILARWRQSAAGLGRAVAIARDGEVVRGVLEGIDEAGRLVVRAPGGALTTISAGDVHFGMTASLQG